MLNQTVLLVDDKKNNLFALENMLSVLNIEILKATCGNEALSILLEKNVSIVLLDVEMPGMDGFEVASLMKDLSRTKDIPIIFISASKKNKNYFAQGFELGAVDYICKPINSSLLKDKINALLMLTKQRDILTLRNRELELQINKLSQTLNELKSFENKHTSTKIPNKNDFDIKLNEELSRLQIQHGYISIVKLDLDYFKLFNNRYGYMAGDACLEYLEVELKFILNNTSGFLARYDSAEFAIILPNFSNDRAVNFAEDLRHKIESLKIPHEKSDVSEYLTASFGVVTELVNENTNARHLISAADIFLYSAKKSGRNKVVSM